MELLPQFPATSEYKYWSNEIGFLKSVKTAWQIRCFKKCCFQKLSRSLADVI